MEAFPGSDALSLPGHPAGEALESVDECAAWLSRYVEWKRAGRAVVAGNSLGGAIALRWALDFPDQVAGLVLLGSGARLRVSPEIFEMLDNNWPACIDTLVGWAVSAATGPALRERAKAWHLTVGQESTRRDYAACNVFNIMDEIANIRVPTLIIVGSADIMTPPKYSRFMHERIAGSTLAVIEGAGHLAMAEHPEPVNDAIRVFLSALG